MLDGIDASEPRSTRGRHGLALTAASIIAIAVVAAGVAWWAASGRVPDDRSLEAGFARDMIVHHDQGVAMALLARQRTDDPRIATLATDIMLAQQNQIGQMLGWLNLWGLPATGLEPAMAWMGQTMAPEDPMAAMDMPEAGARPGMATPEELARLESSSGEAFDAEFLRLMIRHHQGALPMAEMAVERGAVPVVRSLARSIVAAQAAEIVAMEKLLQEKSLAG